MKTRIVLTALAAGALAVPTAAVAHPGHGKGHHGHSLEAHGKAKQPHKVMFIFKGTFTAPGTLVVASGNSHVRKGGFVGQTVTFDLSGARVVAADTNADNQVDLSDVKDGDVVLVQARMARRTKYADGGDAISARKLVDRTDESADDAGGDAGDDAPSAP